MVGSLGVLTLRLSVQSGELQRADARVRLLAAATEQTADLILITRANGAFEHANDAFVNALGYTREELTRMTLPSCSSAASSAWSISSAPRSAPRASGAARYAPAQGRLDVPGVEHGRGAARSDGQVTHFVGVERDITEELKLRDQLVHSERLSAIGELIAGVAHEINNPLQTIIGCVELMLDEHEERGPRSDLEIVRRRRRAPGRSSATCWRSCAAAPPDRVAADLNELVRAPPSCATITCSSTTSRWSCSCAPAPLPVLVNREEIQQIVLNLVLNAEHAILVGRPRHHHDPRRPATARRRRIEVTDDGPGISPELRGRVFEPFFTTKDVGEGTGLGLSIALGIATSHGGSLELRSAARRVFPVDAAGARAGDGVGLTPSRRPSS